MHPRMTFCKKCDAYTPFVNSKAFVTQRYTNTRPGEPTEVTEYVDAFKCSYCGHSFTTVPLTKPRTWRDPE